MAIDNGPRMFCIITNRIVGFVLEFPQGAGFGHSTTAMQMARAVESK